MIDLKPDQPGGQVAVIVVCWILAGLIGFGFRSWLLNKYRIDLKVSRAEGASRARLGVSRQRIASTVIHLVVKVLVIIVGLGVAWTEYTSPVDLPPPILTTGIGILLIPVLLDIDAFLEWRAQRRVLRAHDHWPGLIGPN